MFPSGATSESPVLDTWCGNVSRTHEVRSLNADHAFYVTLQTDGSTQMPGFQLQYVVLPGGKLIHVGERSPKNRAVSVPLRWRHNGCDSVSTHQPHDCLLNRLFRHRSKKTSKLRVTGLCTGNSPVTGEFPAQTASNAENVSIWWRHHVYISLIVH